MSYCRSGEDSDVYVYGTRDRDGQEYILCHVAYNRGTRFEFTKRWMNRPVGWLRTLLVHAYMHPLNHKRLRNPNRGRTFSETDPANMAEVLIGLRLSGLKVPQRAIDRLQEEARA
jgi:hypothetical protein